MGLARPAESTALTGPEGVITCRYDLCPRPWSAEGAGGRCTRRRWRCRASSCAIPRFEAPPGAHFSNRGYPGQSSDDFVSVGLWGSCFPL